MTATTAPHREADWPVATLLATHMAAMRHHLDACVGRPWANDRWPPPNPGRRHQDTALANLLTDSIRDPLRDCVRDAVFAPLALELGDDDGLAWRGQHDAYWVGHYDAWRRVGGVHTGVDRQLDLWATLARSCGWWWPQDGLCVISERPVAVRTEPTEDGRALRLHADEGPAMVFADGWALHSWHGTRVPSWVMTDPNVDRIAHEPNIEVRRCAIERIGWDAYIDQACLRLVAVAPDPGNQGSELHLYDVPDPVRGKPGRILLVVNGSLERDGQRRRYGLSVPAYLDDPLDAAGWTYGLSGSHYAQLARRT